eukprot:Sdes_comp13585_c0_seq1m3247
MLPAADETVISSNQRLSTIEETNRQTFLRNILVCVDTSEESMDAFKFALNNLIRDDDLLTLVHAYQPPFPSGTSTYSGYGIAVVGGGASLDAANKEASEKHASYLRTFGQICRDCNIHNFKLILIRGDAREELVHYTENHPVDMLVVGCRGRGAVKRALLGSVSDYLVHHSACPVVVVRSNTTK